MTLNTRKGDKFCLNVDDDDDDNEMNIKFKDVVEVRTQPFFLKFNGCKEFVFFKTHKTNSNHHA